MKSSQSKYPVYVVVVVAVVFSLLTPQFARAATFCDSAKFLSDISVPDGTVFKAGEAFTKTWRLGNNGSCAWTAAYSLVYAGGDRLGAPETLSLPVVVKPGFSIDLSLNMVAPSVAGHYRASWKLRNAAGALFGIGSAASDAFWVDINVAQADTGMYDFTTNGAYAKWLSGAGPLNFPAQSGDYRGYAMPVNAPRFEDGSTDNPPGLLTVPQNKTDGYIQATYPEFLVQAGDHFQTQVGCELDARNCYVTFRVDTVTPSGRKTLWTWKEKYDSRIYRADIDLTPLAGQQVSFILMVLASGDAANDRAIWGAPHILRGSGGVPVLPTFTPTQTLAAPPPTVTLTGCDKASYVGDVTVPFGEIVAPGTAFTKTWRLKNIGTCTWTTAYTLVFYGGERMAAPSHVRMPSNVEPGQTVDVSVDMVAPPDLGTYTAQWALRDPSGTLFGFFMQGPSPFIVQIEVKGASLGDAGYDFAANYCSARWISGTLDMPCPGVDGDPRGAVIRLDAPRLEDGTTAGAPGLLTLPQNKIDGYIQGIYPVFTIQQGDRFEADLGCQYGATDCYVTYRLDTLTPGGTTKIFWSWRERYEGQVYHASVNLSPLAGQSLRFVLTVLASGPASGDRALWGSPRIVRAGGASPTPSLTPTPTAPPSGWPTYVNAKYGFRLNYPPDGQISASQDNSARINLPIVPGTNLGAKYLLITVVESLTPCTVPAQQGQPAGPPEQVVLNGISFIKQTWMSGYTGHMDDWTTYLTQKDNACVTLAFYLHSTNPGVYATPIPVFDRAAESAVFEQMAASYTWQTLPPTVTPGVVTNVTVAVDAPPYCTPGNQVFITGSITTSAATLLVYHWEVGGDTLQGVSPDIPLSMTAAGSQSINYPSYPFKPPCGNYYITLIVTSPNESSGMAAFSLFPPTITPTLTPTLTPSPSPTPTTPPPTSLPADWLVYTNPKHGFQISRPPGEIVDPTEDGVYLRLPFVAQGTNLVSKYLQITTSANGSGCGQGINAETLTLNGIVFQKQTIIDSHVGAGRILDLDTYFTFRGSECIQLMFVLQSGTLGAFATGTPQFSRAAEAAVFEPMIRTFAWLAPTPTPIPTPAPTATSVALAGPFAVWRVASTDVLNIRSAAGEDQPITGSFAPTATDVMLTANSSQAGGRRWAEVQRPDGSTGWVDTYYLTEYVPQASFCADSRVSGLLGQLQQAFDQSDGSALSGLVSPAHGLDVRMLSTQPAINFDAARVAGLFQDGQQYDWGSGVGGTGSFAGIVLPALLDVMDYSGHQITCDDPVQIQPATNPWPEYYNGTHFYSLHKPATQGVETDYRTWLVGIEYVDGRPYVFALMQFVYQP